MRITQLLALAAVSLLTMNLQCSSPQEEPCPAQDIAGTTPRLSPCVVGYKGTDAQLFVINSVAEYSAAFPCASTLPSRVNFADSTLLVGWKPYANCGHVKSQSLVYSCTPATYTYTVAIEPGACAAAIPVTSVLLVPKLRAGTRVVIDMQ